MQMMLWVMTVGNSTAQARLVMVSTVTCRSSGLMLSAESLGFPHPLASQSRFHLQVVWCGGLVGW